MTVDAKRCTQAATVRGATVECSDVGTWVLDKKLRTWRPALPTERARRCWAHGPGSEVKLAGRGGRRKSQPNARLQRMGGLILDIAPEVTKALEEINAELAVVGFPGSSSGGGASVTTDRNTEATSSAAVRIAELTAWREDLRGAIDDLPQRIDAIIHIVGMVRKVRHAHGVKLCAENQQSRIGSIIWGDPTCTELPTKNGLCSACYQAERRYRAENGLPSSSEPAA